MFNNVFYQYKVRILYLTIKQLTNRAAMRKVQKLFNHTTFGQTPSFNKKDSSMKDSLADPQFDFSDDLINQYNGISIIPALLSSRQKSIHQDSVVHFLRSIQENNYNISNDEVRQLCFKNYQNKEESINNEQSNRNDTFQTGHFKSPYLSKCHSNGLQEHINQYLLRKQKKMRDLKVQLQQKQMQQCTFTPNSHLKDRKDKTPKRNLQQFLKNQQQHVTKIQKKRQDLKKKAEEIKRSEEVFKPQINRSQKVQTQRNKNRRPAHQRLYYLKDKQNKMVKNYMKQPQNKDKMTKKLNSTQNQVNLNKSSNLNLTTASINVNQVSNKRHGPTFNLLYEDAQRRNNVKTIKNVNKSKPSLQSFQKPKNKNNERYGAQKFIKQFCYVLQCMKLLPNPSSYNSMQADANFDNYYTNGNNDLDNHHQNAKDVDICSKQFSHQQYNGILRGLGFLIYDEQSQAQLAYRERSLAYQGFKMLQHYGVNIRNLCIFLLSLLGIFNINPINFYDNEQNILKNGQFQIDQKKGRKIQKHYDLLYRNRLISNNKRSATPSKTTTYNNLSPYTHHSNCPNNTTPNINFISPKHEQHTKQLATKYRTKMIQRANQRFISNNIDIVLPNQDMLTHQDLLVIDNLGKNLQIKRMRQNKQMFVDQQCTFHPKVNDNGKTCGFNTDRGLQKSMELYEYAKTKRQLEKHTQSTHQKINRDKQKDRHTDRENYFNSYNNTIPNNHFESKGHSHNPSINSQFSKQNTKRQSNQKINKNSKSPSAVTNMSKKNIEGFESPNNFSKFKQEFREKQRQRQFENKSVNKKQTAIGYAKDVDKAVARMTLGRKQRQLKNKLLQRGEPDLNSKKIIPKSPIKTNIVKTSYDQQAEKHAISAMQFNHSQQFHNVSTNTFNIAYTDRQVNQFIDHTNLSSSPNFNQKYDNEQYKDDQPFLVIDVNMGEQTKQIQFFSGDEKRLGRIVDQFCLDFDLDDECKNQLLEMVEIQMAKYLNNIGAESTQD